MKEKWINVLRETAVKELRYFDSIGSTNNEALQWVADGAPDYSLVIADEQTRGRGRFDRRWITRSGASLAFSLILKPTPHETVNTALFSPLCGIAVQEAVSHLIGLETRIKWPNDVLIHDKKFCGILVEAAWHGSSVQGIVLGIGINISPDSVPGEEYQNFPATCLETALGAPVDRFQVLPQVIESIEKWRRQLGSAAFMHQWEENLAFKGEWVRIEHSEKPSIMGRVKGIDLQGHLVLVQENGYEIDIEIGDVHLRPGLPADKGGTHA